MSKPFDLKFIPFSQLHISKLNMRHSETAPNIDDIFPSVKERGIRQPLIVRREGGTAKKPKYGICRTPPPFLPCRYRGRGR